MSSPQHVQAQAHHEDSVMRAHRLANQPAPPRSRWRTASLLERLALISVLASIVVSFGGCASSAPASANIRTAADKTCMQKVMARIGAMEWKSGRSKDPVLLAAAPSKPGSEEASPAIDPAANFKPSTTPSIASMTTEHWVVSSKGAEIVYAVQLVRVGQTVDVDFAGVRPVMTVHPGARAWP